MNQYKHRSHRARLLGAFMALGMGVALSSGAGAEVLLSSQSGWDLSVDGSVNNFLTHQTVGATDLNTGGEDRSSTKSSSHVRSGLLPAVLGVNIKAPTVNGLNMLARFGFYPHTQNDLNNKNQFSGQIDFREVFFKVDGKFGSALVGKTLSLFLGKNILNDMTLLGVGAGANGAGTTTLGRIGYGYVYPNFNSSIRYSTPNFNGMVATFGLYDPSFVGTATATLSPTLRDLRDPSVRHSTGLAQYNRTSVPRLEAEISFAKSIATRKGDVSISSWINGMWQKAKANIAALPLIAAVGGNPLIAAVPGSIDEVNVWGVGGGIVTGWKGLSVEASGYYGRGLGTVLQFGDFASAVLAPNVISGVGGELRRNFGYIAEITYDFGQGTGMGVSYGGSFGSGGDTTPHKDRNELGDLMVWHNINDNLRLIGEYGWQKDTTLAGETQSHIFSVGGFFFF